MRVSINQPAYLPWPGYFARIANVDMHVVLDHVQFEKNGFTNRNRILLSSGPTWLTVPVQTKGKFGQLPINKVVIASHSWREKHWMSLNSAYGKTDYFNEHASFFAETYERDWLMLGDVMTYINSYVLGVLDVATPVVYSSTMSLKSKKDELVIEICKAVGADSYLSGPLGRNYLKPERFEEEGIELLFDDYQQSEYPQTRPGFEPRLSVVDLLFNVGKERAQREICEGR